jgi:hypothetical protein
MGSDDAERLLEQLAAPRAWRETADPSLTVENLVALTGLSLPSGIEGQTLEGLHADTMALWTRWATEYLGFAHELRPDLRVRTTRVVVSTLDTHYVNASSWALPDGTALIVLNRSLITLVYEISRAIAGRAVTNTDEEPPVSLETAGHAVVAVMDWVRTCSTADAVTLDLPAQSVPIAYMICQAAERFILAHEVAHLVLGHHDGCMGTGRQILMAACDGPPEWASAEEATVARLHGEEHEADVLALALVLGAGHGSQANLDPVILFGAVQLFFRIQEEIESFTVSNAAGVVPSSAGTHPAADLRSAVLRLVVDDWTGGESGAWDRGQGPLTLFDAMLASAPPLDERERRAAEAVDAALASCAQSPIPDYASFRPLVARAWADTNEPLVLAALARRLAGALQRNAASDAEIVDRVRAFNELKLVISVVRDLDPVRQYSFREMLVANTLSDEYDGLFDIGADA